MAGVPKWSADEKADAIERCLNDGMAAAHKATGIPKGTLSGWLSPEQKQQMAEHSGEQTKAAVAEHTRKMAVTRAEVHRKLLDRAERMLDRMGEAEVDYRGNVAKRVELDEASSSSCKAFATAAAILIDKYRLEMGEATTITEQAPERNPEHEEEMAKVIGLTRDQAA